MKQLYFDEAGFTGNNLLDEVQPYFCYLGLSSDIECEQYFFSLKTKYGYSSGEVKGQKLCKTQKGQKLLKELWTFCSDRVKFVLHNKKYALAAKIFEYVYEPVFAEHNTILYNSGLHLFFANFLYYDFLLKIDKDAETIFTSFQDFLRSKNNPDFMSFDSMAYDESSFLGYFIKFCDRNRRKIVSEVDFDNNTNSWLLDLTSTSLFSLLGSFEGDGTERLDVICDSSKPLISFSSFLDASIGNEQIVYAGLREGEKHRLTFNLANKIKIEDSKKCISLQMSDFLASSIVYSVNHDDLFSTDIQNLSDGCFEKAVSVMPINVMSDYTCTEINAYLEMLKTLSMSYSKKEKILRIIFLTQFIHEKHKFNLLKYLR